MKLSTFRDASHIPKAGGGSVDKGGDQKQSRKKQSAVPFEAMIAATLYIKMQALAEQEER